MGDQNTGSVISTSDLGTVAAHPLRVIHPLCVAPSTEGELNTFSLDIVPVACMALTDILFEFDSSFVMPDAAKVLADLPGLREKHKNAKGERPPLLIFGHADPVGVDNYNKTLSGRRAMAIYGLLTHDVKIWDAELYGKPFEGDNWQNKNALGSMKKALGPSAPSGRKDVIKAYMELLCPVKLEKKDFLGQGADPKGKADYLGCGEFNPLLLLTQDEDKNLPKEKRNKENQPNRRVVIYLFRPGDRVDATSWPCPAPLEPPAKCHDRFFVTPVKGDDRRKLGPARREHRKLRDTPEDTFACRFYDRISHVSPCEGGGIIPVIGTLKVVKADDHFVPGAESLDVVYQVAGYAVAGTLKVEITSEHYADGPIFARDLTAEEIADGEHTLQWDGKANCEKGDLKGRFIHPLLSPYKVRIFDISGQEGKLEFRVLYAGLKLSVGPWTPDDDKPERADRKNHWTQLRLNELGFFSGPVDGLIGKASEAGIKQYKKYHRDLYTDKTATISDALCDRLQAGDNQRQIFSAPDWVDEGKSGNIFLDCDEYYREYNDLLDPAVKCNHEKDNLSRPCFPIKAEIQLLSKQNELGSPEGRLPASEASGPVKVRWIMEDPAEDTTKLPDSSVATVPSRTRNYVNLALPIVGPPGDNCATRFAGLRPGGAEDHRPPYFKGKLGLLPFEAKEDTANRAYFTQPHTDPSKHKELLGCAMIIARPSYITADSYRFGALLDFSEAPNKSYLEGVYGANVPQAKTGALTVWRRARVGAYVQWAQRDEANEGMAWGNVSARFSEAYIELAAPSENLARDDFMTLANYNTIVQARCTNAAYRAAVQNETTGVAGGAAATLSLDRYAVDFRSARLPGETNAQYGQRLGNAMSSIWDQISGDIVTRLTTALRPRAPMGLIVLDFKAICPTQYRTVTGTAGDVPGGRSAWADRNGITMIEVDINMNQDTLMAHEIGHNFYLSHWEVPAGDGYRRPIDHDQNDHNCMMSYAWNLTGRADGVNANGQLFDGRFCGKCNLKLRGWNLSGAGLPASS